MRERHGQPQLIFLSRLTNHSIDAPKSVKFMANELIVNHATLRYKYIYFVFEQTREKLAK